MRFFNPAFCPTAEADFEKPFRFLKTFSKNTVRLLCERFAFTLHAIADLLVEQIRYHILDEQYVIIRSAYYLKT